MRPFEHKIEFVEIDRLTPCSRNARTHSKRQIEQLIRSIEYFGWTNPILIDDHGEIIAGHGRYIAAKAMNLPIIPVVRLSHLSEADKRAYLVADNRLAENAGWDRDLLAIELQAVIDLGVDIEITGFETAEIDVMLDEAAAVNADSNTGPENQIPPPAKTAVTQIGDLWLLGRHRLLCGNALEGADVSTLLNDDDVDAVFTDPPYNVPITGHVRQAGHREFVMGSGEMSDVEFAQFLASAILAVKVHARPGAMAFICMDWRHMRELLYVGAACKLELKNICVWAKTNAGMGSLYRSQHEMIPVFKLSPGPHINNVELGATGRYRTNVWTYAGVNTFSSNRDEELAMHPTCKPVALVQHAIEDVTKRNDVVLDTFGGSGTTLIAAERCGRRARLMELDPLYCDVILRRYVRYTGKQPTLSITGEAFEEVERVRGEIAAF